MHKNVKNRLLIVISSLMIASFGVYLIMSSLEENITFFYPPSKLQEIQNSRKDVRVGGLVKASSIEKMHVGEVTFTITDTISELDISYNGVLPALFREGQGVVAKGRLQGDIFIASELLTKHDENYMPPDLSKLSK